MLPQSATTELLALYGFKCAASILAAAGDEAKAAAAKLGYPVILKAVAPNVAHRSDAGLVSRKIADDGELRQEYATLQSNARMLSAGEAAVTVEKFVAHDFEVILGVKYDPTFGPVVLCGLGGIFTEVLKDYALRLAPLTKIDAEDMLSRSKRFPFCRRRHRKIQIFSMRSTTRCCGFPILPWSLPEKSVRWISIPLDCAPVHLRSLCWMRRFISEK